MFILNPPQDNRPWTPALRQELLGEAPQKSAELKRPEGRAPARAIDGSSANDDSGAAFRGKGAEPGDGESVALWNPDWRVNCPPFEGAPKKLVEYAGRRNVLLTHPVSRAEASFIDRTLEVAQGRRTTLSVHVAADERGDWQLRILGNGRELKRQVIDKQGERWKRVEVDLTSFAGKTVVLRLENAANDWAWEFGYWSDIEIRSTDLAASAK
jgi:hypothetical protein